MQLPAVIRRLLPAPKPKSPVSTAKDLQSVDRYRGGWFRILEPFTGAFQRNIEVNRDSVLAYHAVYACITLIAQDIGKLRPKLMRQLDSGIWKEDRSNTAHTPVLRKPNRFQNRIKFFENWITSKLIHGNAYILKGRDKRGVVDNLYILDPCRVRPMVADDGSIFYELSTDRLRELPDKIMVPADEIIHDPMVCLFHPLVGVSPIFACGLGAQQGVNIQMNSAQFFSNMSQPGGILTAPGHIEDDTAARLKQHWEENFGGDNFGRTAVLGDGLEYKVITLSAEASQLIEQLKWTAEMVCSTFHVPPWMIGVGTMPAYNNIQALWQAYYSQCLQSLIEQIELCLDEGLALVSAKESLGVEMDLMGLLRMDTKSRYESHSAGIAGGWFKPNEARHEEDMEPVDGGDSCYLQQQNYSLAALAKRDAKPDPFGTSQPAANDDDGIDDEEIDEGTEAGKAYIDAFASNLLRDAA